MDQRSLVGLVLPEALLCLQASGLNAEIEVTGDEGDAGELARVVRVIEREDCYLLTVVYPPSLRLESKGTS